MNNKVVDFYPLVGKLLIANPNIDDIRFHRSVIYIYEHSDEKGALGIVINKPSEKIRYQEILSQLGYPLSDKNFPPVLLGGPEHINHGFILHSDDYNHGTTRTIGNGVCLTETQDILYDIAANSGPEQFLLALGRASWRSGQLEDELMGNVWISVSADTDILFKTPYSQRWEDCLSLLGVKAYQLFPGSGKS